jgi:hypothetical protein
LFLSKGQGLEIGNWNDMQPLHKIYGLITYLICKIYFDNKVLFFWMLQLIFIFIQELLERKLKILNFIIYLYISPNDDLKQCKF